MNLSHCIYLMAVWDRKAGSVLKLSLIFISFLLIYTSMTCFLFPKKRVWELVKFYFIRSFNSFFFFFDGMIQLERSYWIFENYCFMEYEEFFFNDVYYHFLPFTECSWFGLELWSQTASVSFSSIIC